MKLVAFSTGLALISSLAGCGAERIHAPRSTEGEFREPERHPLVGVNCSDGADPCLIDYRHLGDLTRDELRAQLPDGTEIETGLSLYAIRYSTIAGRWVSNATVALPHDDAEPPSAGYHIVANNHGTARLHSSCSLEDETVAIGVAGLYGARRMIGVAPEYPGLGTPGQVPYLIKNVVGASAIDALRAARELATTLGLRISNRFAMVGVGQGGHATLSAAAIQSVYAPDMDIRAFGAVAPPSGWVQHFRDAVEDRDGEVSSFALATFAWTAHYDWKGPSPFRTEMTGELEPIMGQALCAPSPDGSGPIPRLLALHPEEVFDPTFLAELTDDRWDRFQAFPSWAEQNGVEPFEHDAAIRIYQGDEDLRIPAERTDDLVAELNAAGMAIDLERVAGAGHFDVAFGYLGFPQVRGERALEWLRSALDEARSSLPR